MPSVLCHDYTKMKKTSIVFFGPELPGMSLYQFSGSVLVSTTVRLTWLDSGTSYALSQKIQTLTNFKTDSISICMERAS